MWYLLIVFLGLVALPLTISACNNLPDRGYSVSKILGILLFAYLSWILSYVIGYSRIEIFLSLLLICIVSIFIYAKFKTRIDKQLFLRNELVFGSFFLFFLVIRAFNPEIHGGEKATDFMFLKSILNSDIFPPQDSWLSGFRINMYYYFGSLTIATLTKLTGISSYITYNLGMSMIPALAANAMFGIVYNITKSKKAGMIATFIFGFSGNLFPAGVILAHILGIKESLWGRVPEIMDYWGASRIIPHTINEFPYFSFIFGDLHAHVIAIPFVLLTIALILNLYSEHKISKITLVVLSLSLGSIFVFNSWDYPTYAALFILVLIMHPGTHSGRSGEELLKRLAAGILVILLGFLMFIVFFIDFKSSGIQGIKSVMDRTELLNFLVIYNLFLFLIFLFMLINLPGFRYRKVALILLAILSMALFFFPDFQTMAVFVPLGLLSIINMYYFHRHNDKNRLFVSLLIILGLFILVFCELFYFNDLMGGEDERMNTVFKYYNQVWILWSMASGYAIYDLCKKKYKMKSIAVVIFSFLLVLNSIYLITGTYAKTEGFNRYPGLDGIDFMKKTNYGDYDAIMWINMNIKGTPIILEAPGLSYSDTSQISSFTGLRTVIGWYTHEYIWRNNWGELSQRISDVDTIYSTRNYTVASNLLKKYNVSYVYIGDKETEKYYAVDPGGIKKFENTSNFVKVYKGIAEIYKFI